MDKFQDIGIPKFSPSYWAVPVSNSNTVNGTALSQLYTIIQSLTPGGNPLSATNRAALFVLPGLYDLVAASITIVDFCDIIGLGDAKDIIITSTSAQGPLNVVANNTDYCLKNLSIVGVNFSISHAAGIADTGQWTDLILDGKNTEDTSWDGRYIGLNCLTDEILNGNINALVERCNFQAKSCGYSSASAIILSSNSGINKIINCTGGNECFGNSPTSVDIEISIVGCLGGQFCFGYSAGPVTFVSGETIIDRCISQADSFGSGVSDVTINSDVVISNCLGTGNCFGASTFGIVTINGKIVECIGTEGCFGTTAVGSVTSGVQSLILSCTALGASFGSSSNNGALTLSGKISTCTSGSNSFLYSATGAAILNGVIENCICTGSNAFGFGDSVSLAAGSIISECKCLAGTSFGKATNAVDIAGIIKSCSGGPNSFGRSDAATASLISTGIISNCQGTSNCFISSGDDALVAGVISNCIATTNSFGFAVNAVTVSGSISQCFATTLSFGVSSGVGPVLISGSITASSVTGAIAFGACNTGPSTISGLIDNCIADNGFGIAGTVSIISGTISNCNGKTASFGTTSATGRLINCTRTSSQPGVQLGTIDSCTFSENSALSAIDIGAGAIVKYSTIYQAGAGESIGVAAPLTASVYQCALNKIFDADITNNITTPYNVIDTSITV